MFSDTCPASIIVNDYPAFDLLPVSEPREEENIRDYVRRCGEEIKDCGDSMFKFLVYEAAEDCETEKEFSDRMNRGILDISNVLCNIRVHGIGAK